MVLSRDVCATAWSLVEPAVVAAARCGVTERLAGTVVVIPMRALDLKTVEDVSRHTLFQGCVGTARPNPDDDGYTAYAMAKGPHLLPYRSAQPPGPAGVAASP